MYVSKFLTAYLVITIVLGLQYFNPVSLILGQSIHIYYVRWILVRKYFRLVIIKRGSLIVQFDIRLRFDFIGNSIRALR